MEKPEVSRGMTEEWRRASPVGAECVPLAVIGERVTGW